MKNEARENFHTPTNGKGRLFFYAFWVKRKNVLLPVIWRTTLLFSIPFIKDEKEDYERLVRILPQERYLTRSVYMCYKGYRPMEQTMKDETVDSQKAAQMLGVSYVTLGRWKKKGKIKPVEFPAKTFRYYIKDIERILREGL